MLDENWFKWEVTELTMRIGAIFWAAARKNKLLWKIKRQVVNRTEARKINLALLVGNCRIAKKKKKQLNEGTNNKAVKPLSPGTNMNILLAELHMRPVV